MFSKSFFSWNGGQALCACACPDGHAPPFNEKKLFGNILSVKIHFVKSQGIYLESGLVSALNGWTSQKMHEILLCLKFKAVVDVIWKSFLVCLITWMLNFFHIKYFAIICTTKLHRTFLNLQKFNFMFFELFETCKKLNSWFLSFLSLQKSNSSFLSFFKFAKLNSHVFTAFLNMHN